MASVVEIRIGANQKPLALLCPRYLLRAITKEFKLPRISFSVNPPA